MVSNITITSGSAPTFTLSNNHTSYILRVDVETLDLKHVHFGAPGSIPPQSAPITIAGWAGPLARSSREFPDFGRGDFRSPAVCVGVTCQFVYQGYEVSKGKPALKALPSTFAGETEASTLVVHLRDDVAKVDAYLSYTIFADLPAITRHVRLVNNSEAAISIDQLASFSLDLPMVNPHWEMLHLSGDWANEANVVRRQVHLGTQSIQSTAGYSSHFHNPFLAMLPSSTTEKHGEVYGFSLIHTGSFQASVEQSSTSTVRAMIGVNPLHFSYLLKPSESFTTPECVAIYSPSGLGGMSRAFHNLYRSHLSRSDWTHKSRPVLLNNWEATYMDFDSARLLSIAECAAGLGVKLFVMDDGWFGDQYPRVNDHAGLGDWTPNPARFPQGLESLVDAVNALSVVNAEDKMRFGIWVEPEMVNPQSKLYKAHPDWVLHTPGYARTEQRNQLVLDLSLPEVQDYIIDAISTLLKSANIQYVKWDNNRGMHEIPSPATAHRYTLGLYRILHTLTTRFPEVLWEGCASGGGRFDPAILHYWPQSWTSDNTDAQDRLAIQFGTSLVYPPSSMAGHISAVPNHQTGRSAPFAFRAHVAMMCGSFGFELDPGKLSAEEQKAIPEIIKLSERISPLIILGDLYRLALPVESNWPAAQYVAADGESAVVLAFQVHSSLHTLPPALRLEGLDSEAEYALTGVDGLDKDTGTFSGKTLMGVGIRLLWEGDHQSRVMWCKKIKCE